MKRNLLLSFAFFIAVAFVAMAQRTVSGKITDDTGEALPGVNVVIKGTTTGVTTDLDGNFRISVEDGATLIFSYVGFETQEIEVGARTTIDVTLGGATELQEVVVTGYGEQSRRSLTSSVSSVDGEDLRSMNAPTFESALQGRAAGVQVVATSGVLGAPMTVRVRGTSSINASSQPLYVIDGIPVTTGATGDDGGTIGAGFGGPGTNPLVNLNPSEIASIEVLKDGAASAIYGSRGSNGVVLITTRRGANGDAKVSFNAFWGQQEATKLYDFMNAAEFTDIWNYAVGNPASPFHVDPDAITESNWLDLVTQKGFVQDYNVNVSGGDANTKYFASVSYHDEEGYIQRNRLKKYNFRVNLDQNIGEKVTASIALAPSRSENFRVGQENAVGAPITFAALYYPNVDPFDTDGSPNLGVAPNLIAAFNGTPLSNQLGQDFESNITQIITNAAIAYDINDEFNFKTTFATDLFLLEERRKFGQETTDGFLIGSADAQNQRFLNYTWTNVLSYNNQFGDHGLNVLVGTEIQKSRRDQIDVSGNTFANDNLKTLDAAATIDAGGGFRSDFAFAGFFASANYDFQGKYFVALSGRYDGSSRFGADNRYGFFPAVSAGWLISEESFLDGIDVVSRLKLRGSYGRTGNSQIGNFASRGLAAFGRDYSANPGFEGSSLANPGLTWETTDQIDLALEFGVLNNRISGSIGWYKKTTKDLLFDVPLPVEAGISGTNTSTNPSITRNIGEMENTGFEFELTGEILTGDLQWTSSFNIATLKNEVISLPDNDGDGIGDDVITGRNLLREGESISSFYTVEFAGVDPANGDALWFDLEGNTTNAYSADNRKVVGSPLPDFYGGWTNTWRYKGIDLRVFFTFDQGRDLYLSEGRFYRSNLNSLFNQERSQIDYWTPDNTDASVPEPRLFTENGRQHSTRYLEDASYIRMKTLTLGYTLPTDIIGEGRRLRVYIQGQNLLTITDFGGIDPEVNNDNSNVFTGDIFFSPPQAKLYTVGLNFDF